MLLIYQFLYRTNELGLHHKLARFTGRLGKQTERYQTQCQWYVFTQRALRTIHFLQYFQLLKPHDRSLIILMDPSLESIDEDSKHVYSHTLVAHKLLVCTRQYGIALRY